MATAPVAVARHCPGESELKGEPSDSRLAEANHAAIAVFAAMVALAVAGIGFLSRWGFSDNSPLEWAKYVGLSWFLIHFSVLIRGMIGLPRPGNLGNLVEQSRLLVAVALALVAAAGILLGRLDWRRGGDQHSAASLGRNLALVGTLGFLLSPAAVVRGSRSAI